jgi:hypothetical protein
MEDYVRKDCANYPDAHVSGIYGQSASVNNQRAMTIHSYDPQSVWTVLEI